MVSASTAIDLKVLVAFINEEAMRFPSLRKMSFRRHRLFATDLALIGLSVRIGYLVDVVAPQKAVEVFSQLLSRLRLTHSIFASVVHLYEPTSDQSFFVNVPMLLRTRRSHSSLNRFPQSDQKDCDSIHLPSFIRLHSNQERELLMEEPTNILAVLESLMDDLATASERLSITLPTNLTQEQAVPLAALVLEYPVAYIPASGEQLPFLSGVSLDVYDCVLTFYEDQTSVPTTHTLLKFSCPSDLAERYPNVLGPSYIIGHLNDKFALRLPARVTQTILQSSAVHDRVAL